MSASSWRLAYGWAKASGILGASFLGPSRASLSGARNVRELYQTVFGRPAPDLTEPELVQRAERDLSRRLQEAVAGLRAVDGASVDFLVAARRRYEFENAKALYLSARSGREAPPLVDAGPAAEVRGEAFPDLEGMFSGTRFAWLARKRGREEDLAAANRLDRQFYAELWEASRRLGRRDGEETRRLLAFEARLMNCVWAVRLHVAFGLDAEAVAPLLIDLPARGVKAPALEASSLSPTDRSGWAAWRYGALATGTERAGIWTLDPRLFEEGAFRLLRKRFRGTFHSLPLSVTALYAFTRVMEYEADDLQSAFESFALGLGGGELSSLLEARAC